MTVNDPRETGERSADADDAAADNARVQTPENLDGSPGAANDSPDQSLGQQTDQDLQSDSRAGGDPSVDLAEEEKDELMAQQQDPDSDSSVGTPGAGS